MTGIDLDFRPIFSGRCLDAHLVRGYAAIDLFSRLISVNGAGLTEIDLDFRPIFSGMYLLDAHLVSARSNRFIF